MAEGWEPKPVNWNTGTITKTAGGGTIQNSQLLYNTELGIGYLAIQINGTDATTELTMSVSGWENQIPYFGYNAYNARDFKVFLAGNKIQFTSSEAVARLSILFKVY